MVERICSIYVISNNVNKKVYVGQTWQSIQTRFTCHKSPNNKNSIHLHRAFNTHGRENFTIECLAATSSQDIADYLEKHFIQIYDSISNGYNLTEGGNGNGKKFSDEYRKHLSESKTGEKNPMFGKTHSDEYKAKLSKRCQGNVYGTNNKGIKRSDETKRKMSEALKGKPLTKEHRQKLSDAHKGKIPWNKGKKNEK